VIPPPSVRDRRCRNAYVANQIWSDELNGTEMMNVLLIIYVALVVVRGLRQWASVVGHCTCGVYALRARRRTFFLPSPLLGRGRGWGSRRWDSIRHTALTPPRPSPPTRGEGEGKTLPVPQTVFGLACTIRQFTAGPLPHPPATATASSSFALTLSICICNAQAGPGTPSILATLLK